MRLQLCRSGIILAIVIWPSLVILSAQAPVQLSIDWKSAETDISKQAPKYVEETRKLRSASSMEIDKAKVPVLVPNYDGDYRSASEIKSDGNSYVGAIDVLAASMFISGTSSAINRDTVVKDKFEPQAFESDEHSADLSFVKYGAIYNIRIECDNEGDERCSKPEFLEKVAENLVTIGGRP